MCNVGVCDMLVIVVDTHQWVCVLLQIVNVVRGESGCARWRSSLVNVSMAGLSK